MVDGDAVIKMEQRKAMLTGLRPVHSPYARSDITLPSENKSGEEENQIPVLLAQPIEFIQISSAPYSKPKTPGEIKTVEDAMAAVISKTSKDSGLPIVGPLNLHLHEDTSSYAGIAGRSGRLASEVVHYSVAVAQDFRFHVTWKDSKAVPGAR